MLVSQCPADEQRGRVCRCPAPDPPSLSRSLPLHFFKSLPKKEIIGFRSFSRPSCRVGRQEKDFINSMVMVESFSVSGMKRERKRVKKMRLVFLVFVEMKAKMGSNFTSVRFSFIFFLSERKKKSRK